MPADVVGALMFLEDYIRYTKLPRKVRKNSTSPACSTEQESCSGELHLVYAAFTYQHLDPKYLLWNMASSVSKYPR